MDRAKKIWENHGRDEAYYAVATFDKFRKTSLDAEAKKEFFESGREHVKMLRREFESAYGIQFRPHRALDFGCGVGRIMAALAYDCESVTGVDISEAMLAETLKNCEQQETSNIRLQNTNEFFKADSEEYDFIHSYIVLQHIRPTDGLGIITRLVERLEPSGLGMLHITFFDPSSGFRRFRSTIYRDVPFVHGLISRVRGKKEIFLPMYKYDLNSFFRILKENGCEDIFIRFSHHGMYGALVFFRKGDLAE